MASEERQEKEDGQIRATPSTQLPGVARRESGCLTGLFQRGRPRQASGAASDCDPSALQEQVQELVFSEMRKIEESLSKELQAALARLLKANSSAPDLESEVPVSAASSSASAAAQGTEDGTPMSHRRKRFDGRRRWTCAADGAESLATILRRAAEEDEAEEAAIEATSKSPVRVPIKPSILSREPSHQALVRKRTSFDRQITPPESDHEEDEQEALMDQESGKSGSSVVWRIDALDCGDRLAASAAAKKGSASVNDIVELIQSERDSWAQEKGALEARLEDLKEQREKQRREQGHDSEKALLKQKVQELRETISRRSRFGTWFCAQHMQESDDEEDETLPSEREELRETLMTLQAELRRVQKAQAQGQGISDSTSPKHAQDPAS